MNPHDDYRIHYLREHIKAMNRAMEYGVEVLAYCPWSAIDLLSTSKASKNDMDLYMWIVRMMTQKNVND